MPRWLNSLVPLQNAAFTSLNDFNIPELKRPSIRRQLAINRRTARNPIVSAIGLTSSTMLRRLFYSCLHAPKRDVNVTLVLKSHQIYEAFPTLVRFHPCGHSVK